MLETRQEMTSSTRTIRLGTLVTGITYRNPAHVAKIVATLDVLSGGRAFCGLGAAWFRHEHELYGWPFPPLGERYELLEDALELLQSMGQEESGLNQLAHVGFNTLGLQTYLTAGPKEARAWTIRRGATAPEAAGVIHTDFQKGFIKAEVIAYDDLVELGSVAAARAAGKARMEGKDYVMQDGDVVEFRFNV